MVVIVVIVVVVVGVVVIVVSTQFSGSYNDIVGTLTLPFHRCCLGFDGI